MRLLRSTSPSSLLMASLDGARRQLAMHGEAMLHETLAAGGATRAKLATVTGIAPIGPELVGRPGVAGWDPLRIVLDVRGTGRTGYEVADALRQAYDVNVELATAATAVLVVGIGERRRALERVAGDVDEIVKRIARAGRDVAAVQPPHAPPTRMAVAPRDAFLGDAEEVAVGDAVGRVSCESIAGYPPGIPALLPGERITGEVVAYLREIVAGGARLHGASDPRSSGSTCCARADGRTQPADPQAVDRAQRLGAAASAGARPEGDVELEGAARGAEAQGIARDAPALVPRQVPAAQADVSGPGREAGAARGVAPGVLEQVQQGAVGRQGALGRVGAAVAAARRRPGGQQHPLHGRAQRADRRPAQVPAGEHGHADAAGDRDAVGRGTAGRGGRAGHGPAPRQDCAGGQRGERRAAHPQPVLSGTHSDRMRTAPPGARTRTTTRAVVGWRPSQKYRPRSGVT